MFFLSPLRDSETKHENIKEDLPNDKPASETIEEPVPDQTKQEETVDMVGCQKHNYYQVYCVRYQVFHSLNKHCS